MRIMLVAAASARRATLREIASHALHGRSHITHSSRISLEEFSATESTVMLADLDSPALAQSLIAFLGEALPGTGVIALIDEPEAAWVRSAVAGRVSAILARDAGAEDMLLAFQAAASGLVLLHPTSVRGLMSTAFPQKNEDEFSEELSGRERQVLRLVSSGLGNKEIAGQLSLSEHTVKFHISSILGKLHAASRTEAVSLGIRRGLIPI